MGLLLFFIFMISLNINMLVFDYNSSLGGLYLVANISLAIMAFIKYDERKAKIHKRTEEHINDAFKKQGFSYSKRFFRYNNGIALNQDDNQICIFKSNEYFEKLKEIQMIIIDHKDILKCEVVEDGQTVIETSRSSQIGGALLGGLLAGGVGAIIGGLSGRQTSSKEVKSVSLRIVVNNTENPLHEVEILYSYNGKSKDSIAYQSASNIATYWHSLISVLIKKADEEDKKEKNNRNEDVNVADEIEKLFNLKNSGAISEEEYKLRKMKLINS